MQKLNLLVVDDGQSQREMLRDFLRSEGHTVNEAENGETAIKTVLNGHFDSVSYTHLTLPTNREV